MRTQTIGPLQVSEVGLGCNNLGWRLDESASISVVHAALDAGITLFDTADVYGANFELSLEGGTSEQFLGKALTGAKRDQAVIATKFGAPMGNDPERAGASPRWIRQAVEDSLARLGVDVIDLYQVHRPDMETPIAETVGVLGELVDEGKIRAFGHSNFTGEMIEEAAAVPGDHRFVSAQNHWSLLKREVELEVVPACERHDLAVLPYFPLASGMLTGKIRRDGGPPEGTRLADTPEDRRGVFINERNFQVVELLEAWAGARGHSILELAFAWLRAQPSVASVIAGATSVAQVVANAAAAQWVLTEDDLADIEQLD